MAENTKARQAVLDAEEATRHAVELGEWDAVFPAVAGEHEVETQGVHRGHRTHSCYGIQLTCSCGAVLGTTCVVITDEAVPPCEVCRTRRIGEFTGDRHERP